MGSNGAVETLDLKHVSDQLPALFVVFYYKNQSLGHILPVIPAKAGIQLFTFLFPPGSSWMPASAGMTNFCVACPRR